MFENQPKCRIWKIFNFGIFYHFLFFFTLNCDLSGNTFLAIEWDFIVIFEHCEVWPFSFETTLVVWMICCVVVCGNESKWCILMYLATSNDVIQCHRETRNVIRRILLAHSVWKWLKMSHLSSSILAFPINFCLIKNDLSGNTVWPQASGFQKLAKIAHFWHFQFKM